MRPFSSKEFRESLDAILKELVKLKATSVEIDYSGGGDSGQVDTITVKDKKQDVEIADEELKRRTIMYQGQAITLDAALDRLAYDAIDEVGGGDWVNNEGGQGNITIDVASGKVKIHHGVNETVTNYEDYKL